MIKRSDDSFDTLYAEDGERGKNKDNNKTSWKISPLIIIVGMYPTIGKMLSFNIRCEV